MITSACESSGDFDNGLRVTSCNGILSAISSPEYEWAELRHRCLNDGIIVVALKSIADIGSPKYIILSGFVLISSVNLLAKSVDTFLPISKPNPDIRPASLKPIAESKAPPVAKPPATPAPTISSLTIFFNNGFDMLPDTVGAPNVLLCITPYGLSPSF